MNGFIFAIEGNDGVGKSTLCENLKNVIESFTDFQVQIFHFPLQGVYYYDSIKESLRNGSNHDKFHQMQLANIKFGMEFVERFVKDHPKNVALLDRWLISHFVYAVSESKDRSIANYVDNLIETNYLLSNDDIGKNIFNHSSMEFDFRIFSNMVNCNTDIDLYPDKIYAIQFDTDSLFKLLELRSNLSKTKRDLNDTDVDRITNNNLVFDHVLNNRDAKNEDWSNIRSAISSKLNNVIRIKRFEEKLTVFNIKDTEVKKEKNQFNGIFNKIFTHVSYGIGMRLKERCKQIR